MVLARIEHNLLLVVSKACSIAATSNGHQDLDAPVPKNKVSSLKGTCDAGPRAGVVLRRMLLGQQSHITQWNTVRPLSEIDLEEYTDINMQSVLTVTVI